MEFSGWDIIITLIIASYGAILSTYSIWSKRQEHKREVKVTLSFGFIKMGTVSPPMLILSALNTGSKTVTLNSMGLILPEKKYLHFTHPENIYVTFPHDLLEGKNVMVWITNKELAHDLKQEGYSGTIRLKGFYRDAIGNEYKSKTINFDIEQTSNAKTK